MENNTRIPVTDSEEDTDKGGAADEDEDEASEQASNIKSYTNGENEPNRNDQCSLSAIHQSSEDEWCHETAAEANGVDRHAQITRFV